MACLETLHSRIAPRFARAEPRRRALAYLSGLLSPEQRRNGSQLAARIGERHPDGMQRLLTSARWDADEVRDDFRDFVVDNAADPEAILVLDEWQFPKKGDHSVGVARQYSKYTRRVENCQTGLYLTYATRRGPFIIDRELYLPHSWSDDLARRRAAGVPDAVPYRTKGGIGCVMAARALNAGVPMRWFAAPRPFGNDRRLCTSLEQSHARLVVGVRPDVRLPIVVGGRILELRADAAAPLVPDGSWLSAAGARGPAAAGRSAQHLWARLPMATRQQSLAARWLLLRQSPATRADHRFYVCSTERATSLAELAGVAEVIDRNPEILRSARDQTGLDEYEVRQWTAWHRYMTLALAAHGCAVMSRFCDHSHCPRTRVPDDAARAVDALTQATSHL
jgi:SRSO17 transposase